MMKYTQQRKQATKGHISPTLRKKDLPIPAKQGVTYGEAGKKSSNLFFRLVNCEEFVNEPLNEQIEVGHDFTYFKNDAQGKFSFLKYNFILSTATKSMGLFYDNRVRMYSERRLTLLYSLLRGQHATPYLRLKVRRDHLIEDALVNVSIVVCTIKCLQYLSQNFWLMVCEVHWNS